MPRKCVSMITLADFGSGVGRLIHIWLHEDASRGSHFAADLIIHYAVPIHAS